MKKIKVISVFGTRPEATKMVPLIFALQNCGDIESEVCVTAQHREMLDQVLEPFNIKPRYDLNVMSAGQTLHDVVSRVLYGLKNVLEEFKPDLLLAHGDTVTTFAASLAAFYAQVKVGHVEAGLRSYDKYRPFPEEINRKLTTALADLHFAPTETAKANLLKENIPESTIYVTGNTAIDFIRYTIKPDYVFQNGTLNGLDFTKKIVVTTAHRRENWGEPLDNICRAVKRLADDFPEIFIVWPLHPNPTVKDAARKILSGHKQILLTDNINVFDMHNLMRRAYLVLTDSGGLQEEAPAFNLPSVVLREVTER
ncbi:MAG: UDP-N-acetylglucosamine 2-epimerase (non-hydrolyzing), partial [Clostridiales bacterium]|nr:UDP-N-acetylglucosamine 2-epimerase (non-hydrolyzing) [Clostridiales bacterium]